MDNGLGPLSLCLIKTRSPAVQERDHLRLGGVQSCQQGFTKEIVQTIPAPLLVQRDQEEVGSLQEHEHLLAGLSGWCSGHRLAHGG